MQSAQTLWRECSYSLRLFFENRCPNVRVSIKIMPVRVHVAFSCPKLRHEFLPCDFLVAQILRDELFAVLCTSLKMCVLGLSHSQSRSP